MDNFKFISHNNHNAYFNIASDEYLLKKKDGFYVYLWINEPAVIVGVNQNTLKEVNLSYARENNIRVVRRITGGGAVYHDLNNICYSVISNYDSNVNNYEKFSSPIISYLKTLNIEAELSGRNDITVGGKKISGNAQTIYKGRILHHGTLLFDTDIGVLKNVLNPSKLKVESKGIKSVESRVTNIKELLNGSMDFETFFNGLKEHLKREYEEYSFSSEDLNGINDLVEKKFSTYDWNIGYSPKCSNHFEKRFDFGILSIDFNLIEGKIFDCKISGDFFTNRDIRELENKLNGVKYLKDSVSDALRDIDEYIVGASVGEIIEGII